ncbi:MAG: 4Fe-4S binding protein [Ignavibacteriaceae bacterium]
MSKRIGVLYFSPTNTTKRISIAVASGMGVENPKIIDITRPDIREKIASKPDTVITDIDHLIVGSPVYFGKLPVEVIECIKSIEGNGKESTAIVVYGNRDYGIALYHMVEILIKNCFSVIAASAFIGQHSYSNIVPVALGRPDKEDLEKAYSFGANSSKVSKWLPLEKIPIQTDIFSKSDKYWPLKPFFLPELCIQCGECADYCPLGILSPETGTYLNQNSKDQCIGCMACVSNCTENAKIAKAGIMMTLSMKYILRRAAIERQEPLIIFP